MLSDDEVDRILWARASKQDASDECRLAAGWRQQVTDIPLTADDEVDMGPRDTWNPLSEHWAVAPGVAGIWRWCGGRWVRWVVPV